MRDIMMDTVIVLFTNKVSGLARSVTDLTARIVKVGHCNLVPRLNGPGWEGVWQQLGHLSRPGWVVTEGREGGRSSVASREY